MPGVMITLLMAFVLLFSMGLSLRLGSFPTSIGDVARALLTPDNSDVAFIIRELRLPRIVLAVLVGAALAVAGAILQGLVRNPLASPDVIGITSGAAMMAVLFLAFLRELVSIQWLPTAALLGALLSAGLIFLLTWKRGITPTGMVLVGIGLSAGMGAITTLTIVVSDDAAAMTAYVWLTGSLYAARWQDVLDLLPWLLVGIPLGLARTRHLAVMALGDSVATGLGVAIQPSRLILMASSVMLAGAAVAFAGGISFVGLIAPHIAARLVGRQLSRWLPTTAISGALLVLYADLVGRVAFLPEDLPAGIFISAIGAPFFIYLLYRARRRGT
ncbi:FecCD family ABC transporter permease [Halomonas sabkhae]|uniref:FecCD family ABC transporter permease n=1 Tax=Halomonas sabkhae TaxID=626223 RepID=UPI003F4913C1